MEKLGAQLNRSQPDQEWALQSLWENEYRFLKPEKPEQNLKPGDDLADDIPF